MSSKFRDCLMGVLLPAIVLISGCSEKEVEYVIDDEELIRYINSSEDARELFRVDGLFPEEPFTVPYDSAIFVDVIDSTRRFIFVDAHVDTVRTLEFPDGSVEYYRERHFFPSPIGEEWEAEVTVDDYFYGRRLRIVEGDTTSETFERVLTRYGFFLKLGGDSRAYRGWTLWAFNGGGPPSGSMVVQTSNGESFRGDFVEYSPISFTIERESLTFGGIRTLGGGTQHAYKRLDRLEPVTEGAELFVTASEVDTKSQVRLISAQTDTGFTNFKMDRVSTSQYVDTIALASNTDFVWNLLSCQEITRTLIPGSVPPEYTIAWHPWVVPFRIPQ